MQFGARFSLQLTAINPAYETLQIGTAEWRVIWRNIIFGRRSCFSAFNPQCSCCLPRFVFPRRGKKDVQQYGAGLIVNVPFPESEVVQVVEDVAQNTIIRGTKEYNKDEFVTGAAEAKSTPVFSSLDRRWQGVLQSAATGVEPDKFQE